MRFLMTMFAGLLLLQASHGETQAQSASRALMSRQNNINISVSFNIFIAGPTNTLKSASVLETKGRRALYAMAQKECSLLLETIAETCVLRRVSIRPRTRSTYRRGPDGVRMSGTVSYRITPKE